MKCPACGDPSQYSSATKIHKIKVWVCKMCSHRFTRSEASEAEAKRREDAKPKPSNKPQIPDGPFRVATLRQREWKPLKREPWAAPIRPHEHD